MAAAMPFSRPRGSRFPKNRQLCSVTLFVTEGSRRWLDDIRGPGGREEEEGREGSSHPVRMAAGVKVGVLLVAVPRRPVFFWVPRNQSSRLRLPAAIFGEREVPGVPEGRGSWFRCRADPPCAWGDIPDVRIVRIAVCKSPEGLQAADCNPRMSRGIYSELWAFSPQPF